MAQQNEYERPSSEEQKIADLVDDAASRISQMQADIKKMHGQGPHLKLEMPDKKNDPEAPYNKINRLGKSIENLKASTIKKTFELADTLPPDKQHEVIKSAFVKLAPEMSDMDIEKNMRLQLLERFDYKISPDFNSNKDSREKEPPSREQNSIARSKFLEKYNQPANDRVMEEPERERE